MKTEAGSANFDELEQLRGSQRFCGFEPKAPDLHWLKAFLN